MRSDICIYPCDHHSNQVIDYFITPENAHIPPAGSLPTAPGPRQHTGSFWSLYLDLLVLDIHVCSILTWWQRS